MNPTRPATPQSPPDNEDPGFYYGWIVLGVAFLSMFFTGPGQTYSFAIFINSIIEEFGWSRTLISALYSVATTVSGTLMFAVGRLVDRFGARRVNVVALAGLGAASLISSFVANPVMLFLGFFLGRFFGQGTLGLSTGTVAPQWFIRRRALAIMIVGLGNTVASSAYPLLNHFLIATYGWRSAFRILAGMSWLVALPVVLLLLRSKPEDIGLHPDGERINHAKDAPTPRHLLHDEEVSLTQAEAVRTWALWFMAYGFFQYSMVGTGIAFHFVSIMQGQGYTEAFAAEVMSISPIAGITATLLMGFLLDRIRRPQFVMAAAAAVQVVTKFMLASLSGVPAAVAYAILNGASGATLMLAVSVLRPMLFGRRYLGGISGVISVTTVIGSAIGPLYFGAAFDATGGYTSTLLISAVFPAIATVLALLIKKPARPDHSGETAPAAGGPG